MDTWNEPKSVRLKKAATELNVGITTLVEFLTKKGYPVETNPNARITPEQYNLATSHFSKERKVKEQADRLVFSENDVVIEALNEQNGYPKVSVFQPNTGSTTLLDHTSKAKQESTGDPNNSQNAPKLAGKIDLSQFGKDSVDNPSNRLMRKRIKKQKINPHDNADTSVPKNHNETGNVPIETIEIAYENKSNEQTKNNDIFISYSRNDQAIVYPLVERINRELNIQCWMDMTGIQSGEEFEEIIVNAIDKCKIVLFMISDNSSKSKWTKREVHYAEMQKKRIVPVFLDGEKTQGWCGFHFSIVDYIDATLTEQVGKLINNLGTWLEIDKNGNDVANINTNSSVHQVAIGLSPQVKTLVLKIANSKMSMWELKEVTNCSHLSTTLFIKQSLNPAINLGLLARTHPDHPTHPQQKYYLTTVGQAVFKELDKQI